MARSQKHFQQLGKYCHSVENTNDFFGNVISPKFNNFLYCLLVITNIKARKQP